MFFRTGALDPRDGGRDVMEVMRDTPNDANSMHIRYCYL